MQTLGVKTPIPLRVQHNIIISDYWHQLWHNDSLWHTYHWYNTLPDNDRNIFNQVKKHLVQIRIIYDSVKTTAIWVCCLILAVLLWINTSNFLINHRSYSSNSGKGGMPACMLGSLSIIHREIQTSSVLLRSQTTLWLVRDFCGGTAVSNIKAEVLDWLVLTPRDGGNEKQPFLKAGSLASFQSLVYLDHQPVYLRNDYSGNAANDRQNGGVRVNLASEQRHS